MGDDDDEGRAVLVRVPTDVGDHAVIGGRDRGAGPACDVDAIVEVRTRSPGRVVVVTRAAVGLTDATGRGPSEAAASAAATDAAERPTGLRLHGGDLGSDAAHELVARGLLLRDDPLRLLLVLDDALDLRLLALLGCLRLALQRSEAFPGLLQARLEFLDLGLRLERVAAQLVRVQPRGGGQQTEIVKRLLVLDDLFSQLRVLVAVGEIGRGVGQDIGERIGRHDLIEQRSVLGTIGLHDASAEGLSSRLEIILAIGELLLQEPQGEVCLTLLIDELGMAGLDTVEALADLVDALLDRGLIRADVLEVFPCLDQVRPRPSLILLERCDERLGLGDGLAEILLTLLGRGDLVLQTGSLHRRRRRHRDRKEHDEYKHGNEEPSQPSPMRTPIHGRHDRYTTPNCCHYAAPRARGSTDTRRSVWTHATPVSRGPQTPASPSVVSSTFEPVRQDTTPGILVAWTS